MISYVELYNFNPRSREGSDIASAIHAGTKETFQSTLPRGERQGLQSAALLFFKFQSTLPRGERHERGVMSAGGNNFNPRSREGSDCFLHFCEYLICISIHAPARGATFLRFSLGDMKSTFQSTLPRGERRHRFLMECLGTVYFNPRSREGSDVTDNTPDSL